MEFCDRNCNSCPIIMHPNSKMIAKILNDLVRDTEYGDEIDNMIQKNCPNLSVCPICRVDDFCHTEDCKFIEEK